VNFPFDGSTGEVSDNPFGDFPHREIFVCAVVLATWAVQNLWLLKGFFSDFPRFLKPDLFVRKAAFDALPEIGGILT